MELLRGHQEEIRIDLLGVSNSIQDRLDSGGKAIRVPLIDHLVEAVGTIIDHFLVTCHLVNTFLMRLGSMLTIEEEGDQMVAPRLAHDRLHDGVGGQDASRN